MLTGPQERLGKIYARMRPRHFDKIEKHRHREPLMLEVDSNGHVGLVVGRCPRICSKV